MRAALELLGGIEPPLLGRRVAALGDMLELGSEGGRMHLELFRDIDANRVDTVFAAGPLMRALFDSLPASRRGAWADTSAGIEQALVDSIAAGDIVMVKGSNGSRMGRIVAAIKARYSTSGSSDPAGAI